MALTWFSQRGAASQLEALVGGRPVVLVFLPNTNELQRFVWSGAFDELAKVHELHYVLPAEDADTMRKAAPFLGPSNTSELRIPAGRFEKWQEVFQTACVHYTDLSPSFAIRAGLAPGSDGLATMSVEARLEYDKAYDASIDTLLSGMEPLPEIVDLLKRFDPLYCIVPTSLLDRFCNDVVWACDAERVGCVVLQSGWDNMSSKGILYKRTPWVGCWGPQSASHVKRIQRMSKSLTYDLGAPHYELLKPASAADIDLMRAELGVAPSDRLILFGGSFRQFDETGVLRRLEDAIEQRALRRLKILYRPHPWRAARKHEEGFFRHEWNHVVFDPDMRERYEREQAEAGYIKRNVPMFDMVYLSRLLSAVDAVISPMSTLLIEALILGKPTMAIAFGDGKHSHDPSVTSQMTHFVEARKSGALSWCSNPDRLVAECATLFKPGPVEKRAAARSQLLAQVVTREPGTYGERLASFCRDRVEPAARKLRSKKVNAQRGTISHAYGAHRIARDYCGLQLSDPAISGYWMHGWIPAYHNLDPALIALHKKGGQDEGYDFEAQIRDEKEHIPQWVSRLDQADFLISHGYRHVKAIGLPITYLPKPDVRREAGSLLVLPPHSHKSHGPGDPVAERYASMIADLKHRFERIWVGLHEDDIAKRQWVEAFRAHGIDVFPTTDQSDPNTLVRLQRILCSFEYVTTNGYGSHIALAAYCGARVSVYGSFAEFPYERMKVAHAVKMFPRLLDDAYYLCTEEALRKHYPFLFVEPDKAALRQEWGAREVGEPCRVSPGELARLFGWDLSTYVRHVIGPEELRNEAHEVAASLRPRASRVWFGGASAPASPVDRVSMIHHRRAEEGRPRVLFAMAHAGFYRNFEEMIAGLLAADVDVHVAFSKHHDTIGMDDYGLPRTDPHGRFTFSIDEASPAQPGAERLRLLRDLILYSRPHYDSATDLRARFTSLQKPGLLPDQLQASLLAILRHTSESAKDSADALLRRHEDRIAPRSSANDLLDTVKPDYVIVTPLVNFASREVDIVKAARLRGIPTLLAVASWDNLTNKGLIKVQPDRIAVWNRHMAREAVHLHGISPERIWITGATPFDSWFGRSVSRDRKTFCRDLGLNHEHPLIVYLCSSRSIAATEVRVVSEWIGAIRQVWDGSSRNANVIIRPHPMDLRSWSKAVSASDDNEMAYWKEAVVWPLRSKHPSTPEHRAYYFDTLYHADAVVGLNTSAMIEAAILGKPVLTFLGHDVTTSQTGNLHFRYLAEGGFVSQARNLDEHVRQLSAALEQPGMAAENGARFVEDFVRPLGRGISASATLVELIRREIGLPAPATVEDADLGTDVSTLTGT